MRDARALRLYRGDGSTVLAREFFTKPGTDLAAGLITEDGRVIRCRDDRGGLFFFQDTKESLFLTKPPPSPWHTPSG